MKKTLQAVTIKAERMRDGRWKANTTRRETTHDSTGVWQSSNYSSTYSPRTYETPEEAVEAELTFLKGYAKQA